MTYSKKLTVPFDLEDRNEDNPGTATDKIRGAVVRAQIAIMAWGGVVSALLFLFILIAYLRDLVLIPASIVAIVIFGPLAGAVGFFYQASKMKAAHQDRIEAARKRDFGKWAFRIALITVPALLAMALSAGFPAFDATLFFAGTFAAVTTLSYAVRGRVV
ncbi:MAG: hypothetical protein AAGE89_11595 [Pseudomonadota bacterium]